MSDIDFDLRTCPAGTVLLAGHNWGINPALRHGATGLQLITTGAFSGPDRVLGNSLLVVTGIHEGDEFDGVTVRRMVMKGNAPELLPEQLALCQNNVPGVVRTQIWGVLSNDALVHYGVTWQQPVAA